MEWNEIKQNGMEWNEKTKRNGMECTVLSRMRMNVQTEYFAKNVNQNVDLHSTSHSECTLDNPDPEIFPQSPGRENEAIMKFTHLLHSSYRLLFQ